MALATQLYAADPSVNPDADNTKKNQIHNGTDALSADQQSNSASDVEVTRKIRRSLTSDKSLSTYAHNVKIITNNGVVVLKGPVKNRKEKDIVESQAAKVAGADKVRSELEISAN
jgi:osmotically-inducible protein OsmY